MKKNATEVVQANTEPEDCDEDGSANDDYDDEKLEDNDLGDDVDDDDLDEDDQEEIEEELEEDPDSDASGNVTRLQLNKKRDRVLRNEQKIANRALRIKMGKSGAQAATRKNIKKGKDACQRKLWN